MNTSQTFIKLCPGSILSLSLSLLIFGWLKCEAQCPPTNFSVLWSYTLSNNGNDSGWDVAPLDTDNDPSTENGSIVVGSIDNGSTGYDVYMVRLDADGNVVWDDTYDGGVSPAQPDAAYSVIQTSTDSILICGTKKSATFGTPKNLNFWVTRLDLNGNVGTGWPREYGSSKHDIAYCIAEDQDGNYVVVGFAGDEDGTLEGNVTHGTQGDADYWVLKTSPGGSELAQELFYGSNPDGYDEARSVIVDCDNNYVIVGFCASCEDGNLTENYMLKLDNDLNPIPLEEVILGRPDYDHGAYNVIQPYSGIYGICSSHDPYLAAGTSHTNDGCFEDEHDHWLVKPYNDFTENNTFANCTTDVDQGTIYGGTENDKGWAVVQTCDGYLLVGGTQSGTGDNDVDCNHDSSYPYSEDILILKINPADGTTEWAEKGETIGDIWNNEAFSVARMVDGSFMLTGRTWNPISGIGFNFYVVKFELTECNAVPHDLESDHDGCDITLEWQGNNCDPAYELRWKRNNGDWHYVTTTETFYNFTYINGVYTWEVRTKCSPNKYNAGYVSGPQVIIGAFCTRQGDIDEAGNAELTVFPNPSPGNVGISLQLQGLENQLATIEILDLHGRTVFSSTCKIENGWIDNQLQLGTIPSASYQLRLITDNRVYHAGFVLQKDQH